MFKLAEIFTEGMVLQQEAIVPVWGVGEEGESVTIEIQGSITKTKVVNEIWKVQLPHLKAGGRISYGNESLTFINILVGEVWLAGGQSNMDHPLLVSQNGQEESKNADFPMIRYYNVPRRPFEDARIIGWHFEKNIF